MVETALIYTIDTHLLNIKVVSLEMKSSACAFSFSRPRTMNFPGKKNLYDSIPLQDLYASELQKPG